MMSTVGICQKILCWLPYVKRLNGYILKVYTKLSRCKSARMRERSRWSFAPLLSCSLQVARLEAVKVLVSIMMSVSWSNKGKPLKLRHNDISRAHFQGTAQRLIYIRLSAEYRQKYGEDKVGRLVKSMYGTHDVSHIWQLDYVNLICGELGGFRRGKHSAALFHSTIQDVRMAVHGDDFVCLSDDDGLKHIDSLFIRF